MQIDINSLRSATVGAVSISEENGGATFHRFSAPEEEMYKRLDAMRGRTDYNKGLAPAGIKLKFKTDSETLKISATASEASRKYFSFDVLENDIPVAFLANFEQFSLHFDFTKDVEIELYTTLSYPPTLV